MQLILDLDSKVVENMQGYCEQQGISINELVENLFNRHVQEPANIINEIYDEDGNLDDLKNFSKLLLIYVNETILDISDMINTTEENDEDAVMLEVFKRLAQEHIDKTYLLTDLYKVYRNNKEI